MGEYRRERVSLTFASIDGAVVHYRDEGPASDRAVIFINSLGTDFRIWDDVAPLIADQNRVVRYDKRGHGLSELPELPPGSVSIADYARDLSGLLDHLGVTRAAIVGLSIGGMIAQELYRQRSDVVSALILSDTAARIGTEDMWANRIAAIGAGGIEAIADGVMERWFSAAFRKERPAELAGWRMMLTRTDRAGYLTACRALQGADLRPFCPQIRVPTLCFVGEEDGSTPVALVRDLASQIGHARFEIVPGAGHLPNLEKPEAVAGLISAHLRTLPA
jgi:3-oxoadipate enol-lactonase